MEKEYRSSENLKAEFEDRGDHWRVTLINKTTGSPKTIVDAYKDDFPTREDAKAYLVRRYETQSRKKKPVKTKAKRKGGCGCQ